MPWRADPVVMLRLFDGHRCLRTDDWIVEAVQDLAKHDLPVVISTLKEKSDRAMTAGGRHSARLSLILAGFQAGKPFVTLITDYEDVNLRAQRLAGFGVSPSNYDISTSVCLARGFIRVQMCVSAQDNQTGAFGMGEKPRPELEMAAVLRRQVRA